MDAHIPPGAPPDLFITAALDARRSGQPDYRQQARAIVRLAQSMADEPEQALPSFVDLALEVTGACSGGLSLLEPSPAPGVFRWHFLRGELSRFNGATTPRDFSPCGVTLDLNAPALTRHPERFYDWVAAAGVELPEVLLVPLRRHGQPFGTLWVVSKGEGQFTRDHADLLMDLAGHVAAVASQWQGAAAAQDQDAPA